MVESVDTRRRNLDALLGIASTGMFTVDAGKRIRSINRAAEKLLGLRPGEAVGLTCLDIFGPHECSPECILNLTMEDAEPRRDQAVRMPRRDGTVRDLALSTAFLDAPQPDQREVAVAMRDVTEAERIRQAVHDRWVFHDMVCSSGKMKEIVSLIREMAAYDSTVLVLGESGTGKELVARAVHAESPRRQEPFVTVNCSAYSEGILESELFGHVRGAFTGATRDRRGRFESASGGTVFLDEIGEISPAIQVKLLRVLQERTVERVGDHAQIPVDIRVVAATNRDLKAAVRDGTFREDLYYRLNVISVRLPPLRERREDVSALADHFVERFSRQMAKRIDAIGEPGFDLLLRYDWPGNVRELENAIEHAVVRARTPLVQPRDLPPEVRGAEGVSGVENGDFALRAQAALRAAGGRVGRAAEMLGVHRTTLWRWMKKSNTVS